MEEKILLISSKLSNQRHLKALRDSFMTMLPIVLVGGIFAVISSAPITPDTTNAFLLGWANFAERYGLIFSWVNTITLGAMAIYLALLITYYLSVEFDYKPIIPMLISFFGVTLLTMDPVKLAFDEKIVNISFIDGKGLLVAIIVGIVTFELYKFMTEKNIGSIEMPDSVPPSLSETLSSLFTAMVIMTLFVIVFAVFNSFDTTFVVWLSDIISPGLKATDSLWFILIMTIVINIAWWFGIHNATFWGLLGPIMFMNLSTNAAAQASNVPLPAILTESFWAYFVTIGGTGATLSIALILLFSKSKSMKAIGKLGIIPSFFGISEPITFGLPLMLNPVFFLPIFLTGAANATIAYLLMSSNIINRTYSMLSFNMPSIFGAYFSTGSFKAVLLIIGLLVIDMLIYYPFVKIYEKQQLKLEENE